MEKGEYRSSGRKKSIMACEVFRDALKYLGVDRPESPHTIIYLPSHLHLYPDRLKQRMLQSLETDLSPESCTGCLYGRCFPDIDRVLGTRTIERIACGHCYEILLGRAVHTELTASQPGSFFLEKTVIEDFDKLCRIPLELDDPQMRQWYFEHYRQIVYIRQPLDSDLTSAVNDIAELLGLDSVVVDADYSDLAAYLKRQAIF